MAVWGLIWVINLDPTVGTEISKTRPVVIISSDDAGTLCDAFQVRSVSVERFIRKLDTLDSRTLKAIGVPLAELMGWMAVQNSFGA